MIPTYACQTKLKNPNEGSDTYCYNQQASPTPIDREKERKIYREVKFHTLNHKAFKISPGI